ncbi:ABC transporter ATP-binding protein [Natronospora cellulosivora (SeqCode)]
MSLALEVRNLYFNYGKNEILKNINLNVKTGSFLTILGPNGSGKTTLLKNICNLLKPEKGEVRVKELNLDAIKHKELAKIMAVVHQIDEVNFDFSIYDIVNMGRYPYQKRFESESLESLNIVKKSMIETETWKLREKSIHQISGGERQRVMIARALAQEPEILLLDEPISHLDIKHQINTLNLCTKLNKEKGITIVMTLHDINLAARYSEYILLLEKGTIRGMDIPARVLSVDNIKDVYDIDVELLDYSQQKTPYIIPQAIF